MVSPGTTKETLYSTSQLLLGAKIEGRFTFDTYEETVAVRPASTRNVEAVISQIVAQIRVENTLMQRDTERQTEGSRNRRRSAGRIKLSQPAQCEVSQFLFQSAW